VYLALIISIAMGIFFFLLNLYYNFFWSFSVLVVAVVILLINRSLYHFFRDDFDTVLASFLSGSSDSSESDTRFNVLGIIGEAKQRIGQRTLPWQWMIGLLILNGIGLFFVYSDVEIYFRSLQFHIWYGLALLFVYLFVLYKFIFRITGKKKLAWLFVFYPLFFSFSLRTPITLVLMFYYNLLLFPLDLMIRVMKSVKDAQRKDALVWCLWFYGLIITLSTGAFAITDPTNLRFAFIHRIYHGYYGIFLFFCTLFSLSYYIWRKRKRKAFSYPTIGSIGLIIAISSFFVLHYAKGYQKTILDKSYSRNVYNSPLYDLKKRTESAKLPPEALNGSQECLHCHPLAYEQWLHSAHAYAAKNKSFQTILRSLVERHGMEIAYDCATCHEPALAFSDEIERILDSDYLKKSEGVSCRACHFIHWSESKDGVYQIQIPRADVHFPNEARRADFMVTAVLEHISDFTKPHIVTGEACYPCHSLRSKRQGKTCIPLDNVTSYLNSSYAREMNIKCHDCHMPRIDVDKFHYSWRDHRFFGSQIYLDLVAFETKEEASRKLKALGQSNFDFLTNRLELINLFPAFMDTTFKTYTFFNYFKGWNLVRITRDIAEGKSGFEAELLRRDVRESGGKTILELTLLLSNPNLGHDFPSGLFANIVRVWTELTLTDQSGRVLIKTEFKEDDLSNQLGRIEVKADGTPILPYESLEYTDIVNMKFIQPDKGYEDRYSVILPEDVRWPLQLTYVLKYKRYTDHQVHWMTEGEIEELPALSLVRYTTEIL